MELATVPESQGGGPRSGDWDVWGQAGAAGPWDLSFRGGNGGQVATEQEGSDGRAGNYRGDTGDLPPLEIWGGLLEEADWKGRGTCLVRPRG